MVIANVYCQDFHCGYTYIYVYNIHLDIQYDTFLSSCSNTRWSVPEDYI